MNPAFADDTSRGLADDLARALDRYAGVYDSVTAIVLRGADRATLDAFTADCFDAALELRFVETDELGFASSAPADATQLLRELYESLVVLSGIARIADTLSLPVATCANGESLRDVLRPRGSLANWFEAVSGRPFAPPAIAASLLAADRHDDSSQPWLGWARDQPEATKDLDEDDAAGHADLTRVFASRIEEALRAYAATDELVATARRLAPVLIGFARIAERHEAGLRPPDGATALARLLADGLVTRAAADDGDDLATLPSATPWEIGRAAAPLREWLEERG